MAEDGLNKIIKRVYAEDLELIARPTELSLRRQQILQVIKEKFWSDHSSAIKVAIVSLSLAIISAAIYYYNFFTVNAYQALQEKANVEAHLQRRSDLIPNLVKSAGSYLNYEKNIFGHIAEIRGAVAGMKTLEQMNIPDRSVLSKFQAVAEAYPALKASEAYTTLMKELSDTETRIAESRIKYNQIANFYNSRLQMFPGIIFNTFLFRFKPLPVFEASKTPLPDVYQRPPVNESTAQPATEPGRTPQPGAQQIH